MEYLKRVLGIEVLYENKALEHLPNFISTRYDSQKVSLSGQKAVFLYPKTELEQVETLKKHLERVKKVADCPVILVLEQITARQKEYLLREKIAFIVDGKQIYLPFMAAYLQERCDAEKSDREEILPSAQMLLLYYIYEGAKELSTSQAAKDLDLTPTSISRASKQLEGMGFLRSRKIGVQKILLSENSAKELFYKAEKVLLNPVKRTVYVPCEEVKSELLESGYFALAEYSMLNAPSVRCYASEKISQWNDCMTKDLQDSNSQVAVEMWRYDESQYAIIGGTACDILMTEEGLDFRATKDIDLVLIIEAVDAAFGRKFWDYVKQAGYEHRNKSSGVPQFYRFSHPTSNRYPAMIELFTRKLDAIQLPDDAVLTPLPMDEDISSLSAILLDDDYYEFLKQGKVTVDGVTVLDAAYLIPFKAKAWMDLTDRKAAGEHVDSKNIKKHKNDVFRLTELLDPTVKIVTPSGVYEDMQKFVDRMENETVDVKQLGLVGRTKEQILQELVELYALQ